MRYPKKDQKSYLTLSAGHDVGRCPACSPEDYPPYERPPVRVLDRLRAAVAFGVIVLMLLLGSLQGVNAGGPQLPMPSPWPSGSTKPIVHPSCTVRNPCPTTPPTDTLP